MKNTVKIDHIAKTITMDRTFAIKASNPDTPEFRKLQSLMTMFSDYTVKRKTIKKSENKETYSGLTYDFMRDYIVTHFDKEETKVKLEELEEQIYLTKCHSSKYPAVKSWFLEEFKEVKNYGVSKKKDTDNIKKVETIENISNVAELIPSNSGNERVLDKAG